MDDAPRLLFVPVSGAFGMGEYARSLAIARGATQRWPRSAVHFMLSRAAPYAAAAPFPSTLLDGSPTFHSDIVIEFMRSWRPHVVVFDNAGRSAQIRAAHACGARIVYISARRRQRRKAFRLRWMRLLDEHWIAYPEFLAGRLAPIERLQLALLRRPTVRYLDVVLARPACGPGEDVQAFERQVLQRYRLPTGGYVLLVPGGGTGHPRAAEAMATFAATARGLAAAGFEAMLVGVADEAGVDARSEAGAGMQTLRTAPSLPQAELGALLRGARLVICNGGSTLLQAIASGKACLAVPIAGDQPARIHRCVGARVAVAARLDLADMVASATRMMRQDPLIEALAGRAAGLRLTDGVAVAVQALAGLLGI